MTYRKSVKRYRKNNKISLIGGYRRKSVRKNSKRNVRRGLSRMSKKYRKQIGGNDRYVYTTDEYEYQKNHWDTISYKNKQFLITVYKSDCYGGRGHGGEGPLNEPLFTEKTKLDLDEDSGYTFKLGERLIGILKDEDEDMKDMDKIKILLGRNATNPDDRLDYKITAITEVLNKNKNKNKNKNENKNETTIIIGNIIEILNDNDYYGGRGHEGKGPLKEPLFTEETKLDFDKDSGNTFKLGERILGILKDGPTDYMKDMEILLGKKATETYDKDDLFDYKIKAITEVLNKNKNENETTIIGNIIEILNDNDCYGGRGHEGKGPLKEPLKEPLFTKETKLDFDKDTGNTFKLGERLIGILKDDDMKDMDKIKILLGENATKTYDKDDFFDYKIKAITKVLNKNETENKTYQTIEAIEAIIEAIIEILNGEDEVEI